MVLSVRKKRAALGAAAATTGDDDDGCDEIKKDKASKEASKVPLCVISGQMSTESTAVTKKNLANEEREWRRRQNAILKEVEQSLMKQFEASRDPFMSNLIFIENSRDYAVVKYNTLACLIAKAFEKWLALPTTSSLDVVKVYILRTAYFFSFYFIN